MFKVFKVNILLRQYQMMISKKKLLLSDFFRVCGSVNKYKP
jgi:hypothetical protein